VEPGGAGGASKLVWTTAHRALTRKAIATEMTREDLIDWSDILTEETRAALLEEPAPGRMSARRLLGVLTAPAGGGTGGAPVAAVAPGSAPAGGAAQSHPAGDAARGRQVYMAQCVACHNSDPAKPGPVGPPIRGASPELLTAKVVHGTYPDGYKPQRDSKVMPPRPDLAPSIRDLAVYLQ
jgi:mono/diheme cytochrome c family protein